MAIINPAYPLTVGLILLAAGLVTGVIIFLKKRHKQSEWVRFEKFVPPLLVASYVGAAFALLQAATQLELKVSDQHAQAIAQRQELLFQLTLRQDLRGMSLAHKNLRGLYLRGKDLADADLHGADLSGANLQGANLDGADLSGAVVKNANLTHAEVLQPAIGGADFSGSDFSQAHVGLVTVFPAAGRAEQVNLNRTTFEGAHGNLDVRGSARSMTMEDFRGSIWFFASDLTGAFVDLHGPTARVFCLSNLSSSTIAGDYTGNVFVGVSLRGATILTATSFAGADFRGADLRGLRFVSKLTHVVHHAGSAFPAVTEEIPAAAGTRPNFQASRFDASTFGAGLLRKSGGQQWTAVKTGECDITRTGVPGRPAR